MTTIIPAEPHESFKFFFEGDDYFTSLWEDLAHAHYSIDIEIYILENDEIGKRLKEILLRKVQAGVQIKILADAIGSLLLPNSYIEELRKRGIIFKIYHPLRLLAPSKLQLNKRDHRKMVIIDSKIGYLGGINLNHSSSEEFYGSKRWQDTQVRLTGEPVNKMIYHFRRSFKDIRFRSKRMEKFTLRNDVIATNNRLGRNHIRRFIQRYIRRSRHGIQITCAYFIPDIETFFKLKRARKRGVRVQIITNSPEFNDVPLVNRINRPILKRLIKNGIEIYFFHDRMVHTKSVIFDNRIATVGSSNINYRSFFRDREINVFFTQEKYVQILAQQFKKNLANSRAVTLEELKNISWWDKILDGFFYLFRSFF